MTPIEDRLSVSFDHVWNDAGGELEFLEQVHLIDAATIISVVEDCGLELNGLYGDWAGATFNEDTTPMFMAVFTKKEATS